jgi:PKD repeat protein
MQNNFETDYQGNTIKVSYEKGTQPNEYNFTANLTSGAVNLKCQKDNEGAYRWLNEDGSTSAENQELGEAIETYLIKNQITL